MASEPGLKEKIQQKSQTMYSMIISSQTMSYFSVTSSLENTSQAPTVELVNSLWQDYLQHSESKMMFSYRKGKSDFLLQLPFQQP